MLENNTGSVPERAEMTTDEWANNTLKIAEQEISRLRRLGWIPYSLDEDDLRSEAHEVIARHQTYPGDRLRVVMRSRLADLIKREFMKQRAEMPAELQPQAGLPFSVGAIEFRQLTAELTNKQLEAVNLVYLCGETESSAARLLGIAQQVFSRRLTAAVVQMRTFLQSQGVK